MPWRPLNVEKFRNQTAKPTPSPFHSAISQNSRGLSENSVAAMAASVASTSFSSFSYSASSRIREKIKLPCSGRALTIRSDIGSHRDLGLDMRMRVIAFEHEVLIAEGKD